MIKIVMTTTLRPETLNFVRQRWHDVAEFPVQNFSQELITLNHSSAVLLVLGDEIVHYNIRDLACLGLKRPGQVYRYQELAKSGQSDPKTYSNFPGHPEALSNPSVYHDAFFSQQIYFIPHKTLSNDCVTRPLSFIPWDLIPMPCYQGIFPVEGGRKTLFLDRDGVVNIDKSYVYRVEDCEIIPQIYPILEWANRNDYETAILTNQSGIGRGMYTSEDAHRIHRWMDQHFREKGFPVGSFEMAPFHHQGQEGPFKKHSHLRKPFPGMALKVGERIPLELSHSYMVGDKTSDLLWIPLIKGHIIQGSYELDPDISSCQNLSEVLKNLQKDSGDS